MKAIDSYLKKWKVTTNFEPSNPENVIKKVYLHKNSSKMEAQISNTEKDYNDFKIINNKQSVEEDFTQRAVKTTIQIFYDEGLFDAFPNADEVLKKVLFVERRRPDVGEFNKVIQ